MIDVQLYVRLCTGGLLEQSSQANLLELESNLARSTADWKIVIGHHPVYSNGHHNSTAELIQHVQPLLQVTQSVCDLCSPNAAESNQVMSTTAVQPVMT